MAKFRVAKHLPPIRAERVGDDGLVIRNDVHPDDSERTQRNKDVLLMAQAILQQSNKMVMKDAL